jgi:hypothetical protein
VGQRKTEMVGQFVVNSNRLGVLSASEHQGKFTLTPAFPGFGAVDMRCHKRKLPPLTTAGSFSGCGRGSIHVMLEALIGGCTLVMSENFTGNCRERLDCGCPGLPFGSSFYANCLNVRNIFRRKFLTATPSKFRKKSITTTL